MLKDLVIKARSYRRFDSSYRIGIDTLKGIVDTVRFIPSASNKQPLKYIISVSGEMNEKIFSTLAWAASLSDWGGPSESERPTGYIVILTDTHIKESADMDVGIAAQTIRLLAEEEGLGGCMIASIDRDELRKILNIPEYLTISLVIALGKAAEKVVLEEADSSEKIEYYRDEASVHHVPKRKLDEVLIGVFK